MYILGIDPGTGRTGWGVIKNPGGEEIEYIAHGCITTSQDLLMHERLQVLHEKLSEIIDTYKPSCMVVEHIFFGVNSKTAISVSQARGVIMLAAAQKKLPLHEYTSISVKHYLVGSGRAEKKQVQETVRKLLSHNDQTLAFSAKDKAFDDAADALAIAIHHMFKSIEKVFDFPKPEKKSSSVVKKKVKKSTKKKK